MTGGEKDRTKILRGAVAGSQTIQVEISRITKQGDKTADIYLEPNDTVYVPQSFFQPRRRRLASH